MTAYEATYEQTRDPTAVMLRRIVAFVIDVTLTTAVIAIAYVSLAQSTEVPGYLHDACSRTADNVSNCVQLGNTIYTVSGKDVAIVWLSALGISVLNVVLLQGATGGT